MYIEIHLEQNKNAFILFLSDFWSVRCKHLLYMYLFFIAYDLQGTYEYDGIYAPNLLIIIWSLLFFFLLHLTMFQDSSLICLTFGVKCKIWQAIDLVLMSSSYRYWEMSLDYRTLCLCSLCLCHFISFRVFDSLFHSCTKKSICACMSLCVKP